MIHGMRWAAPLAVSFAVLAGLVEEVTLWRL